MLFVNKELGHFQINTKVKKYLLESSFWNIPRPKGVKPPLVNPGDEICRREICKQNVLLLCVIVRQNACQGKLTS